VEEAVIVAELGDELKQDGVMQNIHGK